LQLRKDGLTALIAYAGDAFTVTPLTSDNATISNQLNALTTDIMPSDGSNTLAALKQAVELLQQGGQTQGSILLIADGINANAMAQAKSILGNYKLSILGIGTAEGAPIKLTSGGFLKDEKGRLTAIYAVWKRSSGTVSTKEISKTDIPEGIGDIQNLIANSNAAVTEQTMEDSKHLVEQWAEQGPWLLLLLLPLAALYFRKGLLIVPVIVLMNYPQDSYAFEWQDLWKTPDQQGQQAFDHQQYEQAAAKFKSPDWQAAAQYKAEKYQQAAETLQPLQQPTADVYYNRATALAKAGQLQPALDVYNKALKLNPKHEDALYNKKLVEQALEKQKQDKKQDQDKKKSDSDSSDKDKKDDKSDESQDKPDDQKDQQDKDKQSDKSSDNQKNEDNDQSQNDKSNQSEQQADNDQQKSDEEKQNEQDKQTESNQASQPEKEADDKQAQQQSAQNPDKSDEQKQAQEQWLKRIPDDPAGLLKRKFKYQYSQRNRGSQQE